jgi:hypothetical protein
MAGFTGLTFGLLPSVVNSALCLDHADGLTQMLPALYDGDGGQTRIGGLPGRFVAREWVVPQLIGARLTGDAVASGTSGYSWIALAVI